MSEEHHVSKIQTPPTKLGGILRRLGPGLIIAGSIVGSGELIATTKTGAEAGFALLWLILVGCVIKVFAQVEFGRYSINTGKTAMDGINEIPGPHFRVSWVVWYWFVMVVFNVAQLGGIVGGVGQALAITAPITGDFNELLTTQRHWEEESRPHRARLTEKHSEVLNSDDLVARQVILDKIDAQLVKALGRARPSQDSARTKDDLYWSVLITIITACLLVGGRYGMVQSVSTTLVALFTLVTIGNLFAMQSQPDWAVRWSDIKEGLSFGLSEMKAGATTSPLATALATFGIIGVGASELIAYPYWCLEKGYARFVGPHDETEAWADRAKGWMRVMRWDCWCSMVVYTFATVAFFLLGAAVLYRQGINPQKSQLIPSLALMYEPVFGTWAPMLFLFGAVAVLYSTFFVASAGNARVVSDAIRIYGLRENTESSYRRWVRILCVLIPFLSLAVYYFIPDPGRLVLASGVVQAIMLPMLGGAALFFRYRRCDARIVPSKLWDTFLWLSAFGLLLAGGWAALSKLFPSLQMLG